MQLKLVRNTFRRFYTNKVALPTKAVLGILDSFAHQPLLALRLSYRLPFTLRGFLNHQKWKPAARGQTWSSCLKTETLADSSNPFKSYFDSHKGGRGIWKWLHYFDIYDRHFSKFRDREVHVLEIGVHSGGSLEMWRDYFGPNCHVYGVDIVDECKVYENDWTKIFVGDQADREFWRIFKEQVPALDIIIDDGDHHPEQQIVTLEEMLPHLRPGGVFLCEDVQGNLNWFNSYVHGLAANLNSFVKISDDKKKLICRPTQFQSAICSIHLYPFVTVIETTDRFLDQFISQKQGTDWLF